MLSGLFRQSRRALSAAASRVSEFTIITKPRVAFVAGALAAMPMMTGDDFFEHKFVTRKAPDDIIDFYSTEDFLQIIGVFPFAIQFVLAGVEWDTEKENTMAVHHSMEISFEMTEREEETPEGEKVVAFFQKRVKDARHETRRHCRPRTAGSLPLPVPTPGPSHQSVQEERLR